MSSSRSGSSGTGAGSSGPPHPTNTNAIRDGTSMYRALLSTGVSLNPNGEPIYYVRDLMNGRWVLANLDEARHYHAMAFAVYDFHPPHNQVTEFVNAVVIPDAGTVYPRQEEEIDRVYDAEDEAADPELAEFRRKQKGKFFHSLIFSRTQFLTSVAEAKQTTPKKNGGSSSGE